MMKNHTLFYVLVLCLMSVSITYAQSDAGEPGRLRNPLNPYGGADPWIQFYEGNYYLATTTWRSELIMSKSPTLAGLKTAIPQQIYTETNPSRCCNMWAPEFYLLDGPNGLRWYFYYSAGTSGTLDNQRTHVLESARIGADVMTAPPAVIKQLFKHVLTDKGIEGFLADWAKTGQTILK